MYTKSNVSSVNMVLHSNSHGVEKNKCEYKILYGMQSIDVLKIII